VITATTYKNVEFMHYFEYNKNKLSVDKGTLKKFVKSVEEPADFAHRHSAELRGNTILTMTV
jgi:hypothetical protein